MKHIELRSGDIVWTPYWERAFFIVVNSGYLLSYENRPFEDDSYTLFKNRNDNWHDSFEVIGNIEDMCPGHTRWIREVEWGMLAHELFLRVTDDRSS